MTDILGPSLKREVRPVREVTGTLAVQRNLFPLLRHCPSGLEAPEFSCPLGSLQSVISSEYLLVNE